MLWNLLMLFSIGPIIGFFVYYLVSDRKRSEDYFEGYGHLQLKNGH